MKYSVQVYCDGSFETPKKLMEIVSYQREKYINIKVKVGFLENNGKKFFRWYVNLEKFDGSCYIVDCFIEDNKDCEVYLAYFDEHIPSNLPLTPEERENEKKILPELRYRFFSKNTIRKNPKDYICSTFGGDYAIYVYEAIRQTLIELKNSEILD